MAYSPSIYAELFFANESQVIADSVSVTDGTITAGAVADTRSINQTYLTVQETGQFKIDFTFVGLNGPPIKAEFAGRYTGNPSHNVELKVWNYDSTNWEDVDIDVKDLPHSATDYSVLFTLAENVNYISGGECKIRIEHESSATSSHYMYVDYIDVTGITLHLDVAGTAYQITGFTEGEHNGLAIDGSAGTITISDSGKYWFTGSICFSGLGNSIIRGFTYINGVKGGIAFKRKLGLGGDVGSAAGNGILNLSAGDVLSFRFVSDVADNYLAIDALSVMLTKL